MVEPAAEKGAVLQLVDERVDRLVAARNRAIDALMRQQHAALQSERRAERTQRLAQLPEVRQRSELIEGGDLERHDDHLSGRPGRGNPVKTRVSRALPLTAPPWHANHCPAGDEYAKNLGCPPDALPAGCTGNIEKR